MRIWAQELRKMELWIKRYGLWSLQGQNGLFRRFWGNSRIFGVVGGTWLKIQGLLQNSGIFWGFLGIFGVFGVV
jgi:hypothetical protein